MLGFFRRKKPDETERRLSVEELAAAFPTAPAASVEATQDLAAEAAAAIEAVEAESRLAALATDEVPPRDPLAAVDGGDAAAGEATSVAPATSGANDAPRSLVASPATAAPTTISPAAPDRAAAPASASAPTPVTAAPAGLAPAQPDADTHGAATPASASTPMAGSAAAPTAPLAAAPAEASATTASAPAPTPAPAPAFLSAPAPAAAFESASGPLPAPAAASASASADDDASAPPPAAAGKRGWLERLRGNAFTRSITGLFSRNPKLDDDLLDEIETALITADVGVTATTELVERLRKRMKAREFADANALLAALRADLLAMLEPVARPLVIDRDTRPFVILTIGVNGVGKTTTIGKLARRFRDEGRSLMLAAGDTFRAAAVAQLQAWGDRNGVHVVAQGQNADAASVAFDALQAAKARGTEVLIADTAGRLHTQQGLMAELGKIRRVIQKLDAAAPHEVLLVIDGTTGQNALSQLRQFHAAVGVTGLVVTKLDGTAKGGVVFALAREFGIPIRFAGIGERPEDLRVFDAAAFVDALLPESLGGG